MIVRDTIIETTTIVIIVSISDDTKFIPNPKQFINIEFDHQWQCTQRRLKGEPVTPF